MHACHVEVVLTCRKTLPASLRLFYLSLNRSLVHFLFSLLCSITFTREFVCLCGFVNPNPNPGLIASCSLKPFFFSLSSHHRGIICTHSHIPVSFFVVFFFLSEHTGHRVLSTLTKAIFSSCDHAYTHIHLSFPFLLFFFLSEHTPRSAFHSQKAIFSSCDQVFTRTHTTVAFLCYSPFSFCLNIQCKGSCG